MINPLIPAYETWRLETLPDGRIVGQYETNDDQDLGCQSTFEQYKVDFRDFNSMKVRTGLSHYGISGVEVKVFLDGIKI